MVTPIKCNLLFRRLETPLRYRIFFRCSAIVVIPQKNVVAVSVCGNRTANTDVAVCGSVAVFCKTRPNSWAKQVREIEWGQWTLDFMTL